VGTKQREAALLVQSGHIFDNPGVRIMASGTIFSQSTIVYVFVTLDARLFVQIKIQGFVTSFTTYLFVLPNQFKTSRVMIEQQFDVHLLPTTRCVAIDTFSFKVLSMGRLTQNIYCKR
jgi:hypothetical protein